MHLANILKIIFGKFKLEIARVVFISFISALAIVAISIIPTTLLNRLYDLNASTSVVIFIVFLFFILTNALLLYINEINLKSINSKIVCNFIPDLMRHLTSLPLSVLYKYSSTELSNMVTNYEASLSAITANLLAIFSGITILLILFIYMFYCQPYLAIIFYIIYLFLLLIKILIYPVYTRNTHNHISAQNQTSQFLNESIAQIQKIRTSAIENIIFAKWFKLQVIAYSFQTKINKMETFIWLIEAVCLAGLILIFYLSIYFTQTLNTYLALQFLACCSQLTLHYEKLSTDLITFIHSLTAFNRFSPILSAETENITSSHVHHHFRGELLLSNVSFNNLSNITLHIPAGSFVGLVGPSGAGKSTIFRLLLGLEHNFSGSIFFDNLNTKDLNLQTTRQHFGVVLQSTQLFSGTIFSNLSANTRITLDEAWQLARDVGMDDEINNMPMKMFTYISDNAGDSLSGGQKQKILIARALAAKPKILLLDEATSALDNASQAHIFNHLKSLNITRVIIAHRLSTIVNADKIYQLKNGCLTEVLNPF